MAADLVWPMGAQCLAEFSHHGGPHRSRDPVGASARVLPTGNVFEKGGRGSRGSTAEPFSGRAGKIIWRTPNTRNCGRRKRCPPEPPHPGPLLHPMEERENYFGDDFPRVAPRIPPQPWANVRYPFGVLRSAFAELLVLVRQPERGRCFLHFSRFAPPLWRGFWDRRPRPLPFESQREQAIASGHPLLPLRWPSLRSNHTAPA